ncbi:unnamed protein product [Lasius platythorax]|uniref:Uncharacterized protein n=1 Tax=Lasius platythorax TaxID=488582 RepID=A0AAV2P5X2_9HYME
MSRNTKSHKNVQRRSALSFDGADDSLDHYIDHIVQSNPWKNVEEIEKSDAARIQNVLNEFDDMITQEKTSKAGHSGAKKNPKQPREKSAVKSAIEDSMTTNSEGTSSNMHSNILVPETQVQTKKKASTKRASKTIEKTPSPRELRHNVDDAKRVVRKTSEPNVKEIAVNESVRKTNMKKVMSMTDINPLTSTPKKELPRTVGETAKDEKSIVKTRNPKMTDSENKSKKYVKRKEKKQETKTLEKNAKDIEHCQGEDDAKVSDKDNNLKIKKKSKNALEKNVENKPKEYVKRKEKKQRTKMLKKNAKDIKHCQGEDINIPNEIKNLESSKNKLQKSATSNKSPKPLKNNVENNCQCKSQSKSQCKKKGAENCGRYEQCLLRAKEQSEEKRKHSKSKKAAKAMGKLSRQISVVKKQMECIKNDLESSESSDSDSDYSEKSSHSSSYSTYSSSSSYSGSSSDCSCTSCECYTSDDYTEYTCDSSDSSICSENSGDKKKNKK